MFGESGGTFSGGFAGNPGGTTPSGGAGGTTALGGAGGTTALGGAGGTTALGGAGGTTASGGAGGSTVGRGGTSNGTGGTSGAGNGGASSAGAGTSGGSGGTFGICSGTPAKAVTIYAIGDSTMSVYAANVYPRMGWAQPLGDLFDAKCASVVDKALSGRSSKSFFNEGAWTPIKSALKSGDYVLIQFGHNDEKSEEPTLYTEPQTTYKQYLTTYVNDTRAKQATPILLTSINRNNWDGQTLKDTHGAYPPAVRELARSLKVDLIDLTALTKTYFERIGPAEAAKVFLILKPGQFANYPNGVTDNTHLQESGARTIGRIAMANAYAQKLTLATLLKAVPSAP
jgi:lysophospholipase L1-like esterase